MARLPFNKHVRLGDPQDNGLRPFSVLLAKLDVPMPQRLGIDTAFCYVVSSEWADNWMAVSKTADADLGHGKSTQADQLRTARFGRLAQVYGTLSRPRMLTLRTHYLKVMV
jgi:hypothetical protein